MRALPELAVPGHRPVASSHDRPAWDREGRDWPLREHSRFVSAAGLRWHVQQLGQGPAILLVHGTGAATHSWRGLAPLLAERFTVVAMDLPGHGFTECPPVHRLSLPGMATAVHALLRALDIEPAVAVGHSAGAAVLARMALDGPSRPRRIVSINGALLPLGGLPGQIFSPMARLFSATSLVPRLFARHASFDRQVVDRLLRDTGSKLDAEGVELYRRLACRPGHVAAALGMMAHWDLHAFARDLPRLAVPLSLVVGGNDRTIRPSEAYRVKAMLPAAEVVRLPGLGHLAHEEKPAALADLLPADGA